MKKTVGEAALRELLKKGKAEGILSYQETWQCFRIAGLSPTEEAVIYHGIGAAGIKFIDEREKTMTEGPITEEEKPVLLLSHQEEIVLIKRIREGDKKAEDQLFKANRNLVKRIAKAYKNHGMSFFELMQAGNQGLLKAAENFDCNTNLRFAGTASWWIQQEMIRIIAKNLETMQISLPTVKRINQMIAFAEKGKEKTGKEPEATELAEAMKLTEEEVLELQDLMKKPSLVIVPTKKEVRMDPRANSRKRKERKHQDSDQK